MGGKDVARGHFHSGEHMRTCMKLNIGAGDTRIPGFASIDRKLGSEAYPLTHDDATVTEIRASHILEHFSFGDVPKVLAEWVRVLEPGGRIRIAVPDFNKINDMRDDPLWSRYLMGGQSDGDDYHKSVFTPQVLTDLMVASGITDIRLWASDNTDTASHPCSLNLEGVKRTEPLPDAPPIDADVQITVADGDGEVDDNSILVNAVCCMSIPRVGFNDHWGCVTDVLGPLSIPIVRFTGAFWGHGMQAMFRRVVDNGADWIISVDYDSMFSSDHMRSMLSMMGRHPQIDALSCVQCKRNSNTPMATKTRDGEKLRGVEVDGGPIRCDTAHFGLTILRAAAFKDLPLPWFTATPGPDGTWDHNEHIDDDVHFWKHWKQHGRTLYLNPNVRIGHLELMVSGFDEAFSHKLWTVPDWRKEHA